MTAPEVTINGEVYVPKPKEPEKKEQSQSMVLDPANVSALVLCKKGYSEDCATLDFRKIDGAPNLIVFKKTGSFADCWVSGDQEKFRTPGGVLIGLEFKKHAEKIAGGLLWKSKINFYVFEAADDQGAIKKDYPIVLVPEAEDRFCFLIAPRVEQ